jgi:hypothetical protein
MLVRVELRGPSWQALAVTHDWLRGVANEGIVAPVDHIERKRSSGKVRHVRIMGLCLAAVLVVVAGTASSAVAIKNPTKSPKIFVNCPVKGEFEGFADIACTVGATEPNEGGQFTVGPITVPITKQIVLQYGLTETGEEELDYIPPANGAEAITPAPERVPGEPIADISEAEQNELGWSEGLKYSYKLAQKHHTVKTAYETIELAGIPYTNITNILIEEGVGVEAPVKIKAENKWLSELGDVCYVGSNEEPIVQHLTSGESTSPYTGETVHGSKGSLYIFHEGREVIESGSNLVDNTYAVPAASCTGPNASVIAATIDKEFGLPQPAGASLTEIKGALYLASAEYAELYGGASGS